MAVNWDNYNQTVKIASILERLDRIADVIEKEDPCIAFAIDRISGADMVLEVHIHPVGTHRIMPGAAALIQPIVVGDVEVVQPVAKFEPTRSWDCISSDVHSDLHRLRRSVRR